MKKITIWYPILVENKSHIRRIEKPISTPPNFPIIFSPWFSTLLFTKKKLQWPNCKDFFFVFVIKKRFNHCNKGVIDSSVIVILFWSFIIRYVTVPCIKTIFPQSLLISILLIAVRKKVLKISKLYYVGARWSVVEKQTWELGNLWIRHVSLAASRVG